MFRIPFSLLTDTVILQPSKQTGLGLVVDEDDIVTFRVSISTESKWVPRTDGAVIQDVVVIVSNSPFPVGSVLELPNGERVEVKSLETHKIGRIQSGYRMRCW